MPRASVPASAMEYCIGLVRRYDHDHFLCTTLLPAPTRIAAQVLRAFNVEISLIDRATSSTSAAQIRLQWWRQALASTTDASKVEHPVVEALDVVVKEHQLPMRWLNQIVESRDPDQMRTPKTIADLETLSEASHSTLLYLILHAAQVHDMHADHAASHIGKATGLVTALQAIRFGYTTNLPRSLLNDPLIKLEAGNEPLTDVVYEIASQAQAHLTHARSFRDSVPVKARPVLLPAVPIGRFLDQLQRAEFDIFRVPSPSPIPTQFSLLYHRLRSRF